MRNSGDAIVWRGRPRWTLDALVAVLRERLEGKVLEAHLFGSYARGTADDTSDIDLVVVHETDEPWLHRGTALTDELFDLGPMDLLIYTPSEWSSRKSGRPFAGDDNRLVRVI